MLAGSLLTSFGSILSFAQDFEIDLLSTTFGQYLGYWQWHSSLTTKSVQLRNSEIMQIWGIKKSVQKWHTIVNKTVPEILLTSSSVLFWTISAYITERVDRAV